MHSKSNELQNSCMFIKWQTHHKMFDGFWLTFSSFIFDEMEKTPTHTHRLNGRNEERKKWKKIFCCVYNVNIYIVHLFDVFVSPSSTKIHRFHIIRIIHPSIVLYLFCPVYTSEPKCLNLYHITCNVSSIPSSKSFFFYFYGRCYKNIYRCIGIFHQCEQ